LTKLWVIFAVAAAAVLAATAQPAHASRYLRVGLYDDAQLLYGPIDKSYAYVKALHAQEIRITLYWGGPFGVAQSRPSSATNPDDPAYDWTLYDRAVDYATQSDARVLFSVYGTPSWANGGQGLNVAPTRAVDLRNFVYAAAKRYSGVYPETDGRILPSVREWLAWNEPNNPVFLTPQYKKSGSTWVLQGAADYARICNAVYNGVHATDLGGERVGCGATAPRGNNNPNSARPSTSPIAFLRAAQKAGLKTFDAWAHHPYYSSPADTPTSKPLAPNGAAATAVTLGNIGDLIKVVTQLYGNKRIWITEYGYQTNPPDPIIGVSYAKQAAYLTQAFAIARKNPRIDIMLWFLIKDEPNLAGWQSGLVTYRGAKKPAYNAFIRVAEAATAP
jgi:hypothetical protein